MGKAKDAIIAGSSGRIGRLVVANLNGQDILRMRPRKSNKPPTPKQVLIRDRFIDAALFIESYREYAKKFFGTKLGVKSTSNLAFANVLKAFRCDTINLTINPVYSEIKFSKGKGLPPIPTGIDADQALKITIDWNDNGQGTAAEDDLLVVLLAEDNELKNETLFYQTNTTRATGTYDISLLQYYQGKQMHVWMAFIDQNGLYSSNSTYAGSVTVS